MAIQAIQYLDNNGNVIPVYIDNIIHTLDEWYPYGRNDVKYTLNRTYSVSSDVIIIVAYHGEIYHDPYTTNYNQKTLSFAFKNNSNNKYLYIHDELDIDGVQYTFDYQYVTNCNPYNDNNYLIGYICLDNDINETYYFYKGYNQYPYTESLSFFPDICWTLDTNFNNPTMYDPDLKYPGLLGLYADYLGLTLNGISLLNDGNQLTFCLYPNPSTSIIQSFWGYNSIDTQEVLDRLTIIYTDYYWEGVVMTGVKNPFINVYLPDNSALSDFSYWLWSTSINVTTFQKMIQDPFNAIISLHAIYAPIPSNGSESIKLGNLTANGISLLADHTIINLNCGYVNIPESFQNVLDYDYTTYEIYLPYIGFKPLGGSEIVGGSVSVTYNIDICTGACVANVNVIKNSQNICMYTYSGNCAVQMPITGVNYSSVISGMLNAALTVGTAVATGGVTAPMAVGAVGGAVLNSRANIQRSGTLGGNAGVLAYHKPYIVIKRPVPVLPLDYNQFYGYPTNSTVLLSNCSGYVRIKECHLENIGAGVVKATEDEVKEIETLLKNGVII